MSRAASRGCVIPRLDVGPQKIQPFTLHDFQRGRPSFSRLENVLFPALETDVHRTCRFEKTLERGF